MTSLINRVLQKEKCFLDRAQKKLQFPQLLKFYAIWLESRLSKYMPADIYGFMAEYCNRLCRYEMFQKSLEKGFFTDGSLERYLDIRLNKLNPEPAVQKSFLEKLDDNPSWVEDASFEELFGALPNSFLLAEDIIWMLEEMEKERRKA